MNIPVSSYVRNLAWTEVSGVAEHPNHRNKAKSLETHVLGFPKSMFQVNKLTASTVCKTKIFI